MATSIAKLFREGQIAKIEKIADSQDCDTQIMGALTTIAQCKFVLSCAQGRLREVVIVSAVSIAATFEEFQWVNDAAVGYPKYQADALRGASMHMQTLKHCLWVHFKDDMSKLTLCSVEKVMRFVHTVDDCKWVFDRFPLAFGNAALQKALLLMNTLEDCLWVYHRVSGNQKEQTLVAIGERLKTLDDFVKVRTGADDILYQLARRTMGGILW